MDPRPDVTSEETVAMPTVSASPSPLTSSSRFARTSLHDEGRFVPGTLLGGRYRVIELLGRGGMGEVYRATDLMLGQSVALKFLPDSATYDDRLLERFQSEVRVARQVSHPNVCRVYDLGEIDGHPFISMEFIDGEDLSTLLKRIGRLPADKAIETARKICAGLAAAHDKGVIHRDLKPANIMMDKQGQVVIMDFGLAAVAAQLSGPEARNGTPAYMSPEQLKGTEVTARSDIYALGLVLYELFTGKRPYEASSIPDLIHRQESLEIAGMTTLAADVDAATEGVIRRCLHPDPALRPATALQVSSALPGGDPLAAALAAGETPSPEMVAAAGRTEGLSRKLAVPCLVAVFLCVLTAPALLDGRQGLLLAPHPFPPDVLRHKARETARRLGYPNAPLDSHLNFFERSSLVGRLNRLPGKRDRQTVTAWMSAESPLLAQYRESPSYLESEPYAAVAPLNPAPVVPGMIQVDLDGQGRLRNFYAVPSESGTSSSAGSAIDTLFELSGHDRAKFTETTPVEIPRHAADWQTAFRGPHPVLPNEQVVLEIATWKGRVTMFKTSDSGPFTKPAEPRGIRFWLGTLLALTGAGFAIAVARRNWKQGRVDRRGAFRLAVFGYGLAMIESLSVAHLTPTLTALSSFFSIASDRIFMGLLIWLLYLALEPSIRARWPQLNVTWNRVLTGNWRDPLVAGHVLIGIASGALLWIGLAATELYGQGQFEGAGNVRMLLGPMSWLGDICSILGGGLQTGLIVFFLVVGLRRLLRHDWIAAVVGALLLALVSGDLSGDQWISFLPIYAAVFGSIIFMLLRLGLLATVVLVTTLNMFASLTLGLDPMAWHASTQLMTLAVLLAVAVAAYARSVSAARAATL